LVIITTLLLLKLHAFYYPHQSHSYSFYETCLGLLILS